ncbi:unnamed protein product, partial [Choristocarpus tenellus]
MESADSRSSELVFDLNDSSIAGGMERNEGSLNCSGNRPIGESFQNGFRRRSTGDCERRGRQFVRQSQEESQNQRKEGQRTQLQRDQTNPDESGSQRSSAASTPTLPLEGSLRQYYLCASALALVGLLIRWLWRQLAGLGGAYLILVACRHAIEKARERQGRTDGGMKESTAVGVEEKSQDGHTTKQSVTTKQTKLEGDKDYNTDRSSPEEEFADPPSELRRYWIDSGPECTFKVRGLKYMENRIKVPAGPAMLRLVHVDLFRCDEPVYHIASRGRCLERIEAFTQYHSGGNGGNGSGVKRPPGQGQGQGQGQVQREPPFIFILNIALPGTPVICTVMYWALDQSVMDSVGEEEKKFLGMLGRYAEVPGSGYRGLERNRRSMLSKEEDENGVLGKVVGGDRAKGIEVDQGQGSGDGAEEA